MSKKQREKVEDEVRYHKEINNQNQNSNGGNGGNTLGIGRTPQASGNSPDTTGSVFDTPQPSSTDHL